MFSDLMEHTMRNMNEKSLLESVG
jgi:hypothetical protein